MFFSSPNFIHQIAITLATLLSYFFKSVRKVRVCVCFFKHRERFCKSFSPVLIKFIYSYQNRKKNIFTVRIRLTFFYLCTCPAACLCAHVKSHGDELASRFDAILRGRKKFRLLGTDQQSWVLRHRLIVCSLGSALGGGKSWKINCGVLIRVALIPWRDFPI